MRLQPAVRVVTAEIRHHGLGMQRGLAMRVCAGAVAVLLTSILLVSLALAASPGFTDLPPSHPYHDAIVELASRGVITGYGDGRCGPDDPVIRQQFAKMVVKTVDLPVTGLEICPFADVGPQTGTDPFYPDKYIAVCAQHTITVGKDATHFAPYEQITRQQLITMVTRAADLPEAPPSYVPPFGSGRFYPEEHYLNARKAASAGLLVGLQGMGPTYDFMAPATRGECAQLLYALLAHLDPSPSSTTTTAPPLGYERLGGALLSGPGVTSRGVGDLRVFVRGPSDAAWYRTYGGGAWSSWESAGGVLASAPATIWPPGDACRVFWLGTDSALWTTTSSGSGWLGSSTWGGWPLGSPGVAFTSAPAVASWASGHLDVFVRGADDALWTMTYEWGSNWLVETFWNSLGGALESAPAAVSWGPGRIDVFVRGPLDRLFHKSFDSGSWSGWNDLGGVLLSAPAVASRGVGLLDVFVRGPGGVLWHRAYDDSGGGWAAWEPVPGTMTFESDPAAVSWGPDRIDVFVRGSDNALWHKWWDGSAWHP